ncbi:MAG: Smr/MutS family protein [Pseudomonadota bacterium]
MSRDGEKPMPSRGRPLHPEESRIWRQVTDSVTPLSDRAITSPGDDFAEMMRQHDLSPPARPVRSGQPAGGESVPATRRQMLPPAASQPVASLGTFESKRFRQLSRGSVGIDATLDLHGLRQHEAHGALRRFLVQAQARGARYVTVITGKGSRAGDNREETDTWGTWGAPRERGVLRRVVRQWLEDAEFRSLVVSYTTAPRHHGGEGALYVHVRRGNKPTQRG